MVEAADPLAANRRAAFIPLLGGRGAAVALALLYLGVIGTAASFRHAWDQ